MAPPAPRSPNRTAALFGLSLVATMMTGVGGYQLVSAGALRIDTPAARPDTAQPAPPRAAGAPMCPGVREAATDDRSTSLITFGSYRWADTTSTWSSGNLGVGGVCD